MQLTRRAWIARAGLLAGAAPFGAARAAVGTADVARPGAPGPVSRLAAAWETPEGTWRVGLLRTGGAALAPVAQVEVPTRAHGLLRLPGDLLLAVARRPGDWLLRWSPRTGRTRWAWAEPDRVFNGHALLSADARRLYTTETRLDTGDGVVGVREAGTLRKVAEWPTHGRDPHQLLWDAQGRLLVANGGIATAPETGRAKLAQVPMDSSMVRLSPNSGELDGQWRLADPRLSIRHLAWSPDTGSSGAALQAEHDDTDQRQRAPVLALFDGKALRTAEAPFALSGYGGDVAATERGFAVGCPRAGGIAHFDAAGRWQHWTTLPQACALAIEPGNGQVLWAGGANTALRLDGRASGAADVATMKLDNHWIPWAA